MASGGGRGVEAAHNLVSGIKSAASIPLTDMYHLSLRYDVLT